jgi:hypothetical protein
MRSSPEQLASRTNSPYFPGESAIARFRLFREGWNIQAYSSVIMSHELWYTVYREHGERVKNRREVTRNLQCCGIGAHGRERKSFGALLKAESLGGIELLKWRVRERKHNTDEKDKGH